MNEDAARSNGDRAAWTAYHDVSKAYDSVEFWAQEVELRRLKLPEHFIGYMREVTRRGTSRVQTAYGLTDAIEIERGVRQGAVLSPFVFNAFMEPLAQLLKQGAPYVTAGGTKVQGFFFADDIWNVSGTYAGIKEKVIITAEYMGFFGMSLNTQKTHLTTTWGGEHDPIRVRVWKKGWYRPSDGFAEEDIEFHPPTAEAKYLGLKFRGDGCSRSAFNALNGKFMGAIHQLHNRGMTFAEIQYTIQAVVYARLAYGMAITVPSDEDCRRWQSSINKILVKALRSHSISRAVLFARPKDGGLGGKTVIQIRDEVVVTTLLAALNDTGSTVAQLLSESLDRGNGDRVQGMRVNGSGEGMSGFAARVRRVIKGCDIMIARRDRSHDGLVGPTPREVLGLEYESDAHRKLGRKDATEMSDVIGQTSLAWEFNLRGARREDLINARRRVTVYDRGAWVLPENGPIRAWVDDGRHRLDAVVGRAHRVVP